jgi:hypothetical protein
MALCQQMRDDQIPSYTAQFRDLVKSLLAISRSGTVDPTARLPESHSEELRALAAKTVKELE